MSGPHAFEPTHGTDGAELECAVCGEREGHLSHVAPGDVMEARVDPIKPPEFPLEFVRQPDPSRPPRPERA